MGIRSEESHLTESIIERDFSRVSNLVANNSLNPEKNYNKYAMQAVGKYLRSQ